VRWLQLDCNFLGDATAEALATALQSKHCKLEAVDLDFKRIADVGAKYLAEVSLNNNGIGDTGAERLAAVLEKNETVENVDLDGNPMSEEMSSRIGTPRLSTPRFKGSLGSSGGASARPAGLLHAQGPAA